MYKLTDAEFNFYSDAHKDAHGFRPRGEFCDVFQSKEDYDAEINYLCNLISEQIDMERARKREDLREFFRQMRTIMETNNVDLETAIRWDVDAEGASSQGKSTKFIDVDYYCWLKGISYMHCRRIGRILKMPFYLKQAKAA